jgi:hypothetical protein
VSTNAAEHEHVDLSVHRPHARPTMLLGAAIGLGFLALVYGLILISRRLRP